LISEDRAFFAEMVDRMPRVRPPHSVSQWIEGRRVLPAGTPFPGVWRNDRTPYSVEIQDNFSPFSPVRRTIIMKGAQIGMTAVAENVIAFWMFANPTEVLYVSATQDLLEKWGTKRLEPLIDSLKMRDRMVAPTEATGSRRTGDKTFSKSFVGGALDMASAQSAPSLRSDSKRLLVRDEIDGAPAKLKSGEGNWLDVSQARTNAWGERAKILDLSTPGTEEASNIGPAFEEGDQRKWFVPCPHCGVEDHLSLTLEEFGQRFAAERNDTGAIVGVYLVCASCGERIQETHKRDMIAKGHWVPTGSAARPTTRSYHIPTAISLMMSWQDLFLEYDKLKDDPTGVRSFVNLYLGWPFREMGRRPKIDNLVERSGAYLKETVPHGVIYLTAGIDVQRGKDARLEMAVWGHGLGYRTWLVDYRIFTGDTEKGPSAGAWALLNNWAANGSPEKPGPGMVYQGADGRKFPVQLTFIDSGDGNVTATVYQFAAAWNNTQAIKGEQSIRSHEKDQGDRAGKVSEIGYMHSQIGKSGQFFYRIGTNHYKRIIYRNLEVPRQGLPKENLPQLPQFMDFPSDIHPDFFKQLLGEELREDGSYHPVTASARVEALDCTVYAMAAGDVWLHAQTNKARENFKRANPTVPTVKVLENITPLVRLKTYANEMGLPLE